MNPSYSSLNRRTFLQLLGSSAAVLSLNACTSLPTQPPTDPASPGSLPQKGGTLRIVLPDDLTSLDPAVSIGIADVQFAFLLYNTLTRRSEGEAGAPIYPELAESWEINEDATAYTFHLRQNAVFQHGTPLTAKDVEYTINRLLDPTLGAGIGNSLNMIEKIESIDDFTISFHLKEPNVSLPFTLGGPGAQILPHDRSIDELLQQPSGTGPFVLAERTPGERIVLQRNPTYWDPERPYLDEIHLVVIPEPATQIAVLTSGAADFLYTISLESLPLLENAPEITVLESLQGTYPIFVMRTDQKPFDNPQVRQAFKHAIDRNGLRAAMMQGRGAIGNDQPIAPGTPFWADIPPLSYDIQQAKSLLAEAGYPDGLEVVLFTTDMGGPRVNDAAVSIQEMLKAVGVTVAIEKIPAGTFWSETYMQAPFFISWWPVFSDPEGVLPLAYSSSGFYNESGWSDPKVDELIVAARGTQDVNQRKAIYAEIQQVISEQGGVIIPYVAPTLQAIRNSVQGHIPGARIVGQNLWLSA
ncbi:MAG: ABC transporter substrate-binding protein [Caldilinea sp.]